MRTLVHSKHKTHNMGTDVQAPLHAYLLSRGLVGLLCEHRHFFHKLLERLHWRSTNVNHCNTDHEVEKDDAHRKITKQQMSHKHEKAATKVMRGEVERDKRGSCRRSGMGEEGGGKLSGRKNCDINRSVNNAVTFSQV